MMGNLTVGAAQQTVLRLLEGQETCNGTMINTHKICRKSHFEKSRGGWIVKLRQYEDLDLRDTIFVFRSKQLCVFATSLQVPLHITQRQPYFCVLKLFAKFVLFVQSHIDLISVTWHAAAAVRV